MLFYRGSAPGAAWMRGKFYFSEKLSRTLRWHEFRIVIVLA